MKYQFPILIISVLAISFFGFQDADAIQVLSFNQNEIIHGHSEVISCTGCTVGTPTMSVSLSGGPSGSKTFFLYQNPSVPTTYSNFIRFTNCSSCGANDYNVSTSGQTLITLSASGITPSPQATIFQTTTLDNNPTKYGKTKLSITPNSSTICNTNGGDTDGDGICNNWENSSLFPTGTICSGQQGLCVRTSPTAPIYFLSCNPQGTSWNDICPSPTKADLYYEIDYMQGHRPTNEVIDKLFETFKDSPFQKNAQSSVGINLHVQLDEKLPHVNSIHSSGSPTAPGFDQLKYWWFGKQSERTYLYPTDGSTTPWFTGVRSQKAQVFHYVIFAHNQQGNTFSGVAEQPGNDVMISLGSFDGQIGTIDQQQGTLLHEIGHNLNLNHGGNEATNCKPNYLSVMSYSQQFSIYNTGRPLDFSRSLLNSLTENNLSEPAGISPPSTLKTVFGPPTPVQVTAGPNINWDQDSNPNETGISRDINNFNISGCPASSTPVTLNGFLDWDPNYLKLVSYGSGFNSNGTAVPDDRPLPDPTPTRFDEYFPKINLIQDPVPDPFPEERAIDRNAIPCSDEDHFACKDGMQGNLHWQEIDMKDVINMRVDRIKQVISHLDNIPATEFAEYENSLDSYIEKFGTDSSDKAISAADNQVRISYTDTLNEIRQDIAASSASNTMMDAYSKMLVFQKRLDKIDNDELLKSDSPYLNSTQTLVSDVINSQSFILPEFSTFSILVLAIVFTSIVLLSGKYSFFNSKFGYSNI